MDLNSLPDKMLTIIMKKQTFPKMLQLRKMNYRIDRLARRYDILVRFPVEKFKFYAKEIILHLRDIDAKELGYSETIMKTKLTENCRINSSVILEQWLSRITIFGTLFLRDLFIFDKLCDVIRRKQKSIRCLSTVELENVKMQAPLLPNLSQMCPHLTNVSILSSSFYLAEDIFVDQKIYKQNWNTLSIIGLKTYGKILFDDQFLLDVAPNYQKLVIFLTLTNFTISGAIEMMKRCISNNTYTKQSIRLGSLKLGQVPLERLENVVNTKIPEIKFTSERFLIKVYQLTYQSVEKEVTLEFQLDRS